MFIGFFSLDSLFLCSFEKNRVGVAPAKTHWHCHHRSLASSKQARAKLKAHPVSSGRQMGHLKKKCRQATRRLRKVFAGSSFWLKRFLKLPGGQESRFFEHFFSWGFKSLPLLFRVNKPLKIFCVPRCWRILKVHRVMHINRRQRLMPRDFSDLAAWFQDKENVPPLRGSKGSTKGKAGDKDTKPFLQQVVQGQKYFEENYKRLVERTMWKPFYSQGNSRLYRTQQFLRQKSNMNLTRVEPGMFLRFLGQSWKSREDMFIVAFWQGKGSAAGKTCKNCGLLVARKLLFSCWGDRRLAENGTPN